MSTKTLGVISALLGLFYLGVNGIRAINYQKQIDRVLDKKINNYQYFKKHRSEEIEED